MITEVEKIRAFKIENFKRLGYISYLAELAVDTGIDWHLVEALVEEGCERTLALDIAR